MPSATGSVKLRMAGAAELVSRMPWAGCRCTAHPRWERPHLSRHVLHWTLTHASQYPFSASAHQHPPAASSLQPAARRLGGFQAPRDIYSMSISPCGRWIATGAAGAACGCRALRLCCEARAELFCLGYALRVLQCVCSAAQLDSQPAVPVSHVPAAGGEGGLLCLYSLDPSAPPR